MGDQLGECPIYAINPLQWFSKREMSFRPKHFIPTKTPVTLESLLWIKNYLEGRFCLENEIPDDTFSFITSDKKIPYFEDSKEAILYELKWS